jgi:hypothetical protein
MAGHNGYLVVTATGKQLAKHVYLDEAIREGLAELARLPEAERKPRFPAGLPKIANMSYPPAPPKNGLILKSYIRGLQRDPADGELIRTDKMTVAEGDYTYAAEPQLDHVWFTQKEWKSLLPEAKAGATRDVPSEIVDRFVTFHLIDKALGSAGFFWEKATGEMKLTVTKLGELGMNMSLTGSARIGKSTDYPIRFQGFVDYDAKKDRMVRFDMIALGKDHGEMRTAEQLRERFQYHYVYRPKFAVVMAIAFELVDGSKDLDRVPPYAVMFESHRTYNRPYFK